MALPPITTAAAKTFPQSISFTASSAAGAVAAANTFIDTLTADTTKTYQILSMNCYFAGSDHVLVLLYAWFEIYPDFGSEA